MSRKNDAKDPRSKRGPLSFSHSIQPLSKADTAAQREAINILADVLFEQVCAEFRKGDLAKSAA